MDAAQAAGLAAAAALADPASASAHMHNPSHLAFQPVPPQPALCRSFQSSAPHRSCASDCPLLHAREADTLPLCVHSTEAAASPSADADAKRGVPFVLYRLAPGEEREYSLLRRTLGQHGDTVRRTINLRHALLHWTQSRPSAALAGLMRPDCRVLHFAHFTEITHKHRWQSAVRKSRERNNQWADAIEATDPARAHRLRHALDFYPLSLLLPSDRLALLDVHRRMGGRVSPALQQEALTPAHTSRKVARKEKRSQLVGDVITQTKTNNTAAASAASADRSAEEESEPAEAASSSRAATSSIAEPPLWTQFAIPDFLAAFPEHWQQLKGKEEASTLSAAATVAASSAASTSLSSSSAPSAPSSLPIWILKPYARGSGHGILVTDWFHNVKPEWISGQYVACRYIERPLLIDKAQAQQQEAQQAEAATAEVAGAAAPSIPPSPPQPRSSDLRKFDLRLYVLLLSPFFPPAPSADAAPGSPPPPFPFQVFLFRDGLARFASEPYDASLTEGPRLGTALDPFVHLTNNSINAANAAQGTGTKGCHENWSMASLKEHFAQQRAAMDADAAASASVAAPARAKRVCLLGGESSGKSTLSAALASRLGTEFVVEYGRELGKSKGGALEFSDLLRIAQTQVEREEQLALTAHGWLVCDTSPLTTLFYSAELFAGRADPALVALADRPYDVVLLCAPDFPFAQDGTRRDADFRAKQFEWYQSELRQRGIPYSIVRGSLEERVDTAAALLAAHSRPCASSDRLAWNFAYVRSQIAHIVVQSLCVSDSYLRSGLDPASAWSFELLGYDLLIDSAFRVHLCEINSMPDLNSAAPGSHYQRTWTVDHHVKSRMLARLFTKLKFNADEDRQASAASSAPTTADSQMDELGQFERLI